MNKRVTTAAIPAALVTALAVGAGKFGSGEIKEPHKRLNKLSSRRPAAAAELPTTGTYGIGQAANESAGLAHYIDVLQANQLAVFFEGIAQLKFEQAVEFAQAVEAAQAAQAAQTAHAFRAVQPARSRGRGGGGGGGCGEQAIIQRESNGDPHAVNPSSGAGGLYQFIPSTWGGYGGYARAQDAPPAVQKQRFDQVYAGGAGASNWVGC